MEDSFSVDWVWWDSLGMIQAHYIYCAIYSYYYYINSTLDPAGQGPLF